MLNADQEITFTLTVNDCQVVMAGLGELPFRVSAAVVDKIRRQILMVDPDAFGQPVQANGAALHQ